MAYRQTDGGTGTAVLTDEAAAVRAAVVSRPRYDIHVALPTDADNPRFTTTTRIRFDANTPGASTTIDLEADEIVSATLNGKAVDLSTWHAGQFRLDDLQKKNVLEVVSVGSVGSSGKGLTRVLDAADGNAPYFHTQFEAYAAHQVYPSFDQPDIKGWYRWTIDGRKDWDVQTNTPLLGEKDLGDGNVRRRFAWTRKLPTYLSAFVAGPFVSWEDTFTNADGKVIPLKLSVRGSQAKYMEPYKDLWFSILKQSMKFLEDYNGVPYPFPQYHQVVVPGFKAGAMENPGLVTFYEGTLFRGKPTASMIQYLKKVIRHEGSHVNGFGDIRSPRWWGGKGGLYLNETFATLMEMIMGRDLDKDANAAIAGVVNALIAQRVDQMPTNHPVETPVPSTAVVDSLFDEITYEKGSKVLWQLEAALGRDAFKAGMKRYFKRRWDSAMRKDLTDALQTQAPKGFNVGEWADRWLTTKGVSELTPQITTDLRGRMQSVKVEQTFAPNADPVYRSHVLDIGLYDLVKVRGSNVRRLKLRSRVHTMVAGKLTDVPELQGKARPAVMLVNDRDTTYAKVRLDDQSLKNVEQYLGTAQDPLTRAELWAAMWNYMRDGLFSATRFVNMVTTQAVAENQPYLLESLVTSKALGAVESFASDSHRAQLRLQLEDFAKLEMSNHKLNSQSRQAWFNTFVATATADPSSGRPADVDFLRSLFDKQVVMPGIDTTSVDTRWQLLMGLARVGRATADEIRAQGTADPSPQGEALLAQALASLPTKEAKQKAYQQLMSGKDMTPQVMRGLMAGFSAGDASLRAPMVASFADDVSRLVRTRSIEEVGELLGRRGRGGLFPPTSQQGIDSVEAALAKPDLPDPARRALIQGLDDMKRAMAARALDARDTTLGTGLSAA